MKHSWVEYSTLLFGLLTLGLGVILLSILPSQANLSKGFKTPIIAFEFAKTPDDLAFLSGSSASSRHHRTQMDKAHTWDMFFPFAYGGFLALLLWGLLLRGYKAAWLGLPFALLIIPLDILENLVLLDITEALRQGHPALDPLLHTVHIRTWLKWGAIGTAIGFISFGWYSCKEYISALLGGLVALSVAVCWLSGSYPLLTECMSLSIFAFFVGSLGKCAHKLIQNRT